MAVEASPGFAAWLYGQNVALAITTYQIGKPFLIGAPSPDRLSVTERTFQRCLGVAAIGGSLYFAGLNNILRFQNVIPQGQQLESHDAVYVPRVAWYTGDVFAHDVGVLPSGRRNRSSPAALKAVADLPSGDGRAATAGSPAAPAGFAVADRPP